MKEYISRNEAYQELREARCCDACDNWGRGHNSGITEAMDIIKNIIPPADVAPVVHGHWKTYAYEDGFVCAVCSACKWSSGAMWWGYAIKHFDFCPHCGAKMDESEDSGNV